MDYPAYSVMTVYYISTMQPSNLVVSIVEHVYRMIALLLYITSRNSPRCGHLGLFLEVIYFRSMAIIMEFRYIITRLH